MARFPETRKGGVPVGEISGGRLVGKALKAEGVEYIFTLNGGHIYNIFEGVADEGIKIIDTLTSRRQPMPPRDGRG